MADELKPMLSKVLASGGDKKFFFAFGSGKRKDGKGDGELAIGGKKPKKADIEGELAACKELLEGVCWTGKGPDDGDTVYFQGKGKKLAPMAIAKMALTAKRVTGRQYEFQIPSPEEEARADRLSEGEGNEGLAAPATTPASPTETDAGNLEAAYQARVKALTDGLKKAIGSGTAAGNEAKVRFSESQLFSRKKDFTQATALLDVVEEQIQKALAGAGGAPGSKPATTTTANTDPAAEWKKKYAEWTPAIKAAMVAKGPNAAAIAKLLAQATALSKPGGDMALALTKLTECHALANGAAPAAEANGDEARWTARREAVNALYLGVLKKQPPNATLLRSLLAFADGKAEGKDFGQALLGLDKLEKLLQAGNGEANGDAGAKAPAANGDEARWNTRRQAIEAAYLKAVKEQPDKASQLRAVLGFADGKAEAKDFGKALQGLDKLEAAMQGAAGSANGADPAAEWKKKYAEWTPAIKTAMVAKGPNAAAIAKLLAQATALSKPGGDMAQALAKLTECHALATSGAAATPAQAAAQAQATPQAQARPARTMVENAVEANRLHDELTTLMPSISATLITHPERKSELTKLLQDFRTQTSVANENMSVEEGQRSLEAIRALLAAPGSAGGPAETAQAQQPAQAAGDAEARYKKLLDEILPAYKEALVARSDDEALRSLMKQANQKARTENDFPGALPPLQELARLLAKGEPPPDNPQEVEDNYKKLYQEIEGPFQAATEGDDKHPQEDALLELWRLAAKKAGAKNFRGATTELQKLAKLLGQSTATPADANAEAETKKPLTFEDNLRDINAAIGALKDTNPFSASIAQRLDGLREAINQQNALVAQGMLAPGELSQDNERGLEALRDDVAASLEFEGRLKEVQGLIERLEDDRLRAELLYSWNAEQAFARRSGPPVRAYVAGGMQRLATLEQQARAALPAAAADTPEPDGTAQEALNKLVAWADRIEAEIDQVGNDGIRQELVNELRRLQTVVPSAEDATPQNLAKAETLLTALEQRVKDALAADGKTSPAAQEQPQDKVDGAAKPAGAEKKADTNGHFDFAKARTEWLTARNQAQGELKKLKDAILKAFVDQPEMTEISQKINDLDQVLEDLDGGLEDVLGEAAKADATAQPKLRKEATTLVHQYMMHLKGNAMLKEIDANPFTEVRVGKVLTGTLKKMYHAMNA